MELKIETKQLGEQMILLELTGEMDVFSSPVVKEGMTQAVEEGNHYLVIGMGEVRYMDSTGLGVLMGGLKRAREHGGNLCLLAPHHRVRRVLEITNLENVLQVYETLKEAQEGILVAERQGLT